MLMASEQEDPITLPPRIEEWIADRTAETGESRQTVLARAVASYRLLAADEDEQAALETVLSDIESRIDALESETGTAQVEQLESELDEHVKDLRRRIVDVVKEARSRAPTNHTHDELESRIDEVEQTSHENLESRLSEIEQVHDTLQSRLSDTIAGNDDLQQSTEELETAIATLEATVEDRLGVAEQELETLHSRSDKLAGAVVDLRRRLSRMESHASHQTALAKLLSAATHERIKKAECESCGEMVQLGMLIEPACPHCRNLFDGITPGSRFFDSAKLTVSDRPALEAGSTTDRSFTATDHPATADTEQSSKETTESEEITDPKNSADSEDSTNTPDSAGSDKTLEEIAHGGSDQPKDNQEQLDDA
jgi:predicted  nucleic acid-binding Zn-ribbon protein